MRSYPNETHRKRIIVNVLNIVDEQLAGAAIFARNVLSAWLAKEDAADVVVLHSRTIDPKKVLHLPDKPNVTFRSASPSNFASRIVYEQLILPFITRRFDIYFSPTQAMPLLGKLLWRRTKMIITIHDMIPFFVSNKYGRLRSLYIKLFCRWGAKLADRVVVVSQNTLADLVAITKVPASKVRVVYNFLTMTFQADNVNDNHSFICISTVEPGKNLEYTLKGFARFLEKYKLPYSFNWLGKIGWGYVNAELEEKVIAEGLGGRFNFLGFVDEETKQSMLSSCTAMIYLSHYEGFGIPVLEGFYHNKPALAAKSSSLPEVVGTAGILVDNKSIEEIADGMYELVTQVEKYRAQIPSQIRKFDIDNQIKNFMAIIHE